MLSDKLHTVSVHDQMGEETCGTKIVQIFQIFLAEIFL